LKTDQFRELSRTKGFELQREFYSNQYYGAIEWITNSGSKFVLMFADPSHAINNEAARKLSQERMRLITITALRMPAQAVSRLLNKRNKHLKHYLYLIVGMLLYVFSRPIDKYWKRKAEEEWKITKQERNGSEMYLFFKRA
jgi:chlorite dismutase